MLKFSKIFANIYLNSWQIALVSLLLISVFFRFTNLDLKPYWGDEIATSQLISAHPRSEIIDVVMQGEEMSREELLDYHRPSAEKGWLDLSAMRSPHAQLYYLPARLWMLLWGDRVMTPRGVSALISLLAFPTIYWLCLELFEWPLVGWLAIALLAASPVHLLYAQEARSYSLWTVTTLLSSWAILRAMRTDRKLDWGIYAVSIALGLYAHLLSMIITITHGIYVIIRERFRWHRVILSFLFSTAAGFLFLVPWFIFKGVKIPDASQGMKEVIPWASLGQAWILALSRIFFDLDSDFSYQYFPIYLAILILIGYSIYVLCHQAPRQSWLFVCTSIVVPTLCLAIPDFLFGGSRSLTMRYLLPSFLGIQVAVAYLLAVKMTAESAKRWLWRLVTVVIISIGVLSSTVYVQADTWWNKYREYYHSEVAKIINQTDRPLAIAPWFDLVTLNYSLAPHTTLQDIRLRKDIKSVGQGFSDVFVQNQGLRDYFLKNHPNYRIVKTYSWKRQTTPISTTKTELWQLRE